MTLSTLNSVKTLNIMKMYSGYLKTRISFLYKLNIVVLKIVQLTFFRLFIYIALDRFCKLNQLVLKVTRMRLVNYHIMLS